MLNLIVKPKDSIRVPINHPGNGSVIAVLVIAGPDHEATISRRRALQDAAQVKGYTPDYPKEIRETLRSRTIGWEGVNDESMEDKPFDAALLTEVYAQEWLCNQVLDAIRGNEVFFQN